MLTKVTKHLISDLVEGTEVSVWADENKDGLMTRYVVESGALVFKTAAAIPPTGDMFADLYDPKNIESDIFDERNHGRAGSMESLLSINPTKIPVVELSGFYQARDLMYAVVFTYDVDQPKSNHNGGNIIDPSHSATPGDAAWYTAENSGTGCWVADMSSGIWETRLFGAKANTVVEEVDFDKDLHNGGYECNYPYKITERVSGDDDSLALKAIFDNIPDNTTLLISPSDNWHYMTNIDNWGWNPHGSEFTWCKLQGKKNITIRGVSKERSKIFIEQDITIYSLYGIEICGCEDIFIEDLTMNYQGTGYPDALTHPKSVEGAYAQTRMGLVQIVNHGGIGTDAAISFRAVVEGQVA